MYVCMYVGKKNKDKYSLRKRMVSRKKRKYVHENLDRQGDQLIQAQKLLEALGFFPLCKRLGGRVLSGSGAEVAWGL
jgi:hypothetical protein